MKLKINLIRPDEQHRQQSSSEKGQGGTGFAEGWAGVGLDGVKAHQREELRG